MNILVIKTIPNTSKAHLLFFSRTLILFAIKSLPQRDGQSWPCFVALTAVPNLPWLKLTLCVLSRMLHIPNSSLKSYILPRP